MAKLRAVQVQRGINFLIRGSSNKFQVPLISSMTVGYASSSSSESELVLLLSSELASSLTIELLCLVVVSLDFSVSLFPIFDYISVFS